MKSIIIIVLKKKHLCILKIKLAEEDIRNREEKKQCLIGKEGAPDLIWKMENNLRISQRKEKIGKRCSLFFVTKR